MMFSGICNRQCWHPWVMLLFCLLCFPFAMAEDPSSSMPPATSRKGWRSSITSWFASVEARSRETLGHGRGLGAEQITKFIFPGLFIKSSYLVEGTIIGDNFTLHHVQTAPSGKNGLVYKGCLLKPYHQGTQNKNKVTTKLLVWFHGNAEHAAQVVYTASDLFKELSRHNNFSPDRWAVLAVEYPGFDSSEGLPQSFVLENMIKMWSEWLQDGAYKDDHVFLLGRSIGTAMATYWAAQYMSDGLILDAPFASVADIAASIVPIPGLSFFARKLFGNTLETESFVSKVQVPTLVITRGKDEVVREYLGIKQYEAIKATNSAPTNHISLLKADHNNFNGERDQYHKRIGRFLLESENQAERVGFKQ